MVGALPNADLYYSVSIRLAVPMSEALRRSLALKAPWSFHATSCRLRGGPAPENALVADIRRMASVPDVAVSVAGSPHNITPLGQENENRSAIAIVTPPFAAESVESLEHLKIPFADDTVWFQVGSVHLAGGLLADLFEDMLVPVPVPAELRSFADERQLRAFVKSGSPALIHESCLTGKRSITGSTVLLAGPVVCTEIPNRLPVWAYLDHGCCAEGFLLPAELAGSLAEAMPDEVLWISYPVYLSTSTVGAQLVRLHESIGALPGAGPLS